MQIKYTYSAGESYESMHFDGEATIDGVDLLDCNNQFYEGFDNEYGYIRIHRMDEIK